MGEVKRCGACLQPLNAASLAAQATTEQKRDGCPCGRANCACEPSWGSSAPPPKVIIECEECGHATSVPEIVELRSLVAQATDRIATLEQYVSEEARKFHDAVAERDRLREELEVVQGECYLWQADDHPITDPQDFIEFIRKQARAALIEEQSDD